MAAAGSSSGTTRSFAIEVELLDPAFKIRCGRSIQHQHHFVPAEVQVQQTAHQGAGFGRRIGRRADYRNAGHDGGLEQDAAEIFEVARRLRRNSKHPLSRATKAATAKSASAMTSIPRVTQRTHDSPSTTPPSWRAPMLRRRPARHRVGARAQFLERFAGLRAAWPRGQPRRGAPVPAFAPQTERQLGYGLGHFLPAHGDDGEPRIAASRSCSERTSARRLSESTGTKEARRKASTRISRSRLSRNSRNSSSGMARSQATRISRVARTRVASPERRPRGPVPRQRQGVAAQVFGQHDAGQQAGPDGEAKRSLDLASSPASTRPRQAERRTSSSLSFKASTSRSPATRRQGS